MKYTQYGESGTLESFLSGAHFELVIKRASETDYLRWRAIPGLALPPRGHVVGGGQLLLHVLHHVPHCVPHAWER